MDTIFFGLVALIGTAIPSYAAEREKGSAWSMKRCFFLGALTGFIHGLTTFSTKQAFEPIILSLAYGAVCFFGSIPMYFWADTVKDMRKD